MTPARKLVGPFPAGVNPEEYDALRRRVLWSLPAGLYLLGSRSGERRNLMTASFAMQLSIEPKLVGVSVERTAHSHDLIVTGGAFSLSLLAREDRAVVRHFVKPAFDDPAAHTLNGYVYRDAPVTGSPVPEIALVWLDCSVERAVELGSHTLFVGEVVDADMGDHRIGSPALRIEDTRLSYGG